MVPPPSIPPQTGFFFPGPALNVLSRIVPLSNTFIDPLFARVLFFFPSRSMLFFLRPVFSPDSQFFPLFGLCVRGPLFFPRRQRFSVCVVSPFLALLCVFCHFLSWPVFFLLFHPGVFASKIPLFSTCVSAVSFHAFFYLCF